LSWFVKSLFDALLPLVSGSVPGFCGERQEVGTGAIVACSFKTQHFLHLSIYARIPNNSTFSGVLMPAATQVAL